MPNQTYELQTTKFHLYPDFGGYKVYVYDRLLCRSPNFALRTYADYAFSPGDEGIFSFSYDQLPLVKKALRIKC